VHARPLGAGMDPDVRPDQRVRDAAGDPLDAGTLENDRVLDLAPLDETAGADGRVRADEGVADLRTRADDCGAANRRADELRAGLIEAPGRGFDRIFTTADEISTRDGRRTFSSGATQSLLPLIRYVRRCTVASDRLFVAGDMPELYVLTERPFAGGQPALRGGFFETDEDQRRVVARLHAQRVPLVVVLTEGDAASFRIVMADLNQRYEPVRDFEMRNHSPVRLLRSRSVPSTGVDAALGLPCYR